MKSKQDLIEKWELAIESAEFYGKGKEEELIRYMKDFVSDLNQLDEPETLSGYWIEQKSIDTHVDTLSGEVQVTFRLDDLENLLVPKQEEVDQAYKDGYEKGKEHATRDDEPETVASVMADFFGATARFKEVLAMEVEVLENDDN